MANKKKISSPKSKSEKLIQAEKRIKELFKISREGEKRAQRSTSRYKAKHPTTNLNLQHTLNHQNTR